MAIFTAPALIILVVCEKNTDYNFNGAIENGSLFIEHYSLVSHLSLPSGRQFPPLVRTHFSLQTEQTAYVQIVHPIGHLRQQKIISSSEATICKETI